MTTEAEIAAGRELYYGLTRLLTAWEDLEENERKQWVKTAMLAVRAYQRAAWREPTEEEERHSGGCISWAPQVSIPCGVDDAGQFVRYRADALVVLEVRPDGTFVGKLVDKKGLDTPASRAKRAAVKAIYGLSVEILR